MSENTAWQDIVQAIYRLESNRDSYERGHKDGRKDEREHAKTLRDPDRLAEIQQLQEALRRKNEKYQRLRAQYKRLKDTKRPRARIHAYVTAVSRFEIPIHGAPLKLPHYWHAEIRKNARKIDSLTFSTHHEALEWALARLKEATHGA